MKKTSIFPSIRVFSNESALLKEETVCTCALLRVCWLCTVISEGYIPPRHLWVPEESFAYAPGIHDSLLTLAYRRRRIEVSKLIYPSLSCKQVTWAPEGTVPQTATEPSCPVTFLFHSLCIWALIMFLWKGMHPHDRRKAFVSLTHHCILSAWRMLIWYSRCSVNVGERLNKWLN